MDIYGFGFDEQAIRCSNSSGTTARDGVHHNFVARSRVPPAA
jgi:hypothetical protein